MPCTPMVVGEGLWYGGRRALGASVGARAPAVELGLHASRPPLLSRGSCDTGVSCAWPCCARHASSNLHRQHVVQGTEQPLEGVRRLDDMLNPGVRLPEALTLLEIQPSHLQHAKEALGRWPSGGASCQTASLIPHTPASSGAPRIAPRFCPGGSATRAARPTGSPSR